ncbi:unnamed protein product [Ectocarpus sp. CCAP 1310/34]|nr:unnamed protein product [Ectocarpus sp. CCAP 1310/34]
MSYPTNENSRWEPPPRRPSQGTIVLAPRRRSIIRDEEGEGENFEEKLNPPLGRWHQHSLCPCRNPNIMLYSLFCCCCAMGDIGCYLRENWMCYPPYCLGAWCPCCVGDTRELVAEKYNLPLVSWDPDEFGWCFVKMIGARLMCFCSVCLMPCLHISQMRAEVAFRKHGKATVCPCCCCGCGGGQGPGETTYKEEELDYPRDDGVERPHAIEEADYPREGGKRVELTPEKEVKVVLDYPR